jgi:hypothetical protein
MRMQVPKALGGLAVAPADIRRSPHWKTVLLGRYAPCADCDFRAVARFAHNDTARAE